jgi:hypothetical protein
MPSSTSSSNRSNSPLAPDDFVRPVPHGNWFVSFVVALVVALGTIGAWELHVRSLGFEPTLDDTGDLWAANRSKISSDNSGRTVVIGSSRTQFDFDLDAYATYFKTEKPIQLALPGSVPLPVLENLAADENVSGTVIVGVVPGLFFAPPNAFPFQNSLDAIERFEDWSPSQQSGHWLGLFLDKNLAFIEKEEHTLGKLLAKWTKLPNRPDAQVPPTLPPYFCSLAEDRRARLWEGCGFGSPLAERIQNIWIPLFTPPPTPPIFTDEEFRAMFMASVESYLERTTAAVDKIRARGGKVVFVRFPSSDKLREMENQLSPRPVFWEAILARTGAPGIHFEDYPGLSEFKCPEWSHLRSEDADIFSERLMPILAEKLQSIE